MVSCTRNLYFEGCTGSRETSCAALYAQCLSTCFSDQFFHFLADLDSKGGPGGGPTKDPRASFSITCSILPLLGAPGEPRVANTLQEHKTKSKNNPKQSPKGAKATSQRPAHEPNHSKTKSIDQSIDPGTVAGLPQAVGMKTRVSCHFRLPRIDFRIETI